MIAIILVPFVSRLSVRVGGMDTPDDRKVHNTVVPRLGGIAIFCAFLFAVLFFIDIDHQIKGFMAGAVVIFLTGLIDDLSGLRPRYKCAGEILAVSVAVVSGGISLTSLGNPFGLGEIQLGALAIPFTIFAVVGVINAINLIDGLDGLAGGIAAIASLAFGILAWKTGNYTLLVLLFALLGAIFGFLYYNTHPAKIFMGDCGSLFLGYCMGLLPILLLNHSGGQISPLAPLIILGVPILDTLVVMSGRIMRGASIACPDKTHIHHRLLELGAGHRLSVLIIYGTAYTLAFVAILLQHTSDVVHLIVLIFFFIILYVGLSIFAALKSSQNFISLKNSITVQQIIGYRSVVHYSSYLLIAIKYLLLLILTLTIFVDPLFPAPIAWIITLLILVMLWAWLAGSTDKGQLLKSLIYCSALLCLFIIENYGRKQVFNGFSILWISHALFALLLLAVGIKVAVRNRFRHLFTRPIEYLILFVVVAVPLLPRNFASEFHLPSVAAKSIVVLAAYKLILLRQAKRNQKVIIATILSLFVLVIRFWVQ